MTFVSAGNMWASSIPLRSGIWMSRKSSWGRCSLMALMASTESVNEPSNSRSGVLVTKDSSSLTARGSSSTIMQVIFLFTVYGLRFTDDYFGG